MTYSKYNVLTKIGNRKIVYNLVTDSVITDLDKDFESLMEVKKSSGSLNYVPRKLLESKFVVESHDDELSDLLDACNKIITSLDELTVVIGTTLNCNFACIYCKQEHRVDTNMSDATLSDIIDFIKGRYDVHPFKKLNISFFGGEPMLNHRCVESAITIISQFAQDNGIELYYSFTTNGSVIRDKTMELLATHKVSFQITVDGSPDIHNKNRPFGNGGPSYQIIMSNIEKILYRLPYARVVLRLNYDISVKPHDYYALLNSINGFPKERIAISLNKIFQIDGTLVPIKNYLAVIALFNRFGFAVNSSTICKSLCSASYLNYAFFRYDGKRVICSSTSDISDKYSDELINISEKRKNALTYIADECKECIFLPKCMNNCVIRKIDRSKCRKYLPDEIAAQLYVKQELIRKKANVTKNSKQIF